MHDSSLNSAHSYVFQVAYLHRQLPCAEIYFQCWYLPQNVMANNTNNAHQSFTKNYSNLIRAYGNPYSNLVTAYSNPDTHFYGVEMTTTNYKLLKHQHTNHSALWPTIQ